MVAFAADHAANFDLQDADSAVALTKPGYLKNLQIAGLGLGQKNQDSPYLKARMMLEH